MQLNQVRSVKTDMKLNLNKTNPPSELTKDYRMDVVFIAVEQLEPYALQARKIFDQDELQNLSDTIKTHGIRNPLTVVSSSKDGTKYQIISGERRWLAAKMAGLTRVPCIINENHHVSQEIALIENIQRKDLSTIELLEGIEAFLNNNLHLPKEEVIAKLGMSKAHFYKILGLAPLTKEVRAFALKHQTPIDKLSYIAKASPDRQLELIGGIEAERKSISTDQTANDLLNRAMNKKAKVLEIKVKGNQIESDSNFYVLSEPNKQNIITLLKKFILELEEAE